MSTNLIVRLRLRFAKWPGMTRTKLENTSPSAHIISDICQLSQQFSFQRPVFRAFPEENRWHFPDFKIPLFPDVYHLPLQSPWPPIDRPQGKPLHHIQSHFCQRQRHSKQQKRQKQSLEIVLPPSGQTENHK